MLFKSPMGAALLSPSVSPSSIARRARACSRASRRSSASMPVKGSEVGERRGEQRWKSE